MTKFFCWTRLALLRLTEGLWRRTEAFVALEFALIAPVMIFTLLAAADIANAISITRRMTNTADVIAQLVTQQTSSGQITGTINDIELSQDFNAVITTIPDVLGDSSMKGINWQSDIEVIASSVTFGPSATCTPATTPAPTCTDASVTWSVGFNNPTGTGNGSFPADKRPCGFNSLSQETTNTDNPSLGTVLTKLPPGLYAPGTVIVVDVIYVFNPLFTKFLTGPFTFTRTAFLPPRFFTQLTYTPGPAASPPLTNCVIPPGTML